jgi:crossover junction endodeoxyribonuclease RuvC
VIVAGIDPGLAHVGVALVATVGTERSLIAAQVISTPPNTALENRWSTIYKVLSVCLAPQGRIDAIGIEDQHGAWIGHAKRGTTSAAALRAQECVGMARAWALERGIPVFIISPKEVKLAVLGRGASRAGKSQILRGIRGFVRDVPIGNVPEHASDAIAIAIAAGSRFHVEGLHGKLH